MKQTRVESLIEVLVGTAFGFVLSILISIFVYPAFGHAFSLSQNAGITSIFTIASILRGYAVRRFFNQYFHAFAKWVATKIFRTSGRIEQ